MVHRVARSPFGAGSQHNVAQQNLNKTGALWSSTMPPLSSYDDHDNDRQKLLRHMEVEFVEDRSEEIPKVRMIPRGKLAEWIEQERDRKQALGQLATRSTTTRPSMTVTAITTSSILLTPRSWVGHLCFER